MGVPTKPKKITKSLINGSSRHGEKRCGKIIHRPNKLPRDMLVEILGLVASSSFTTLFNAKLSCKDLMEATQDDSIFQHISINKFPIIHWIPLSDDARSFLTHCFHKQNPESLFRQGMIDYFNLANVESGLELLKRAVEKGHLEATYVYGMILLSHGDQSSQQGLNLLNSMKCSRALNVQDCRARIKSILNQMWIENPVLIEEVNTKCQEQDHQSHFRRMGWSLDDDKVVSSCDTCMWYRELRQMTNFVSFVRS